METETYITAELFAFLAELRQNNNREWFQANKARYQAVVRDPLLALIEDFAPRLHQISPHYLADPRPVGGSLFRIYRDVRFSRDKSPYKTWAAVHFRHRQRSRDVHTPGFYLHLEPGNVFVGAGIWQPPTPSLRRIRDAIAERPQAWQAALNAEPFRHNWTLTGESLKRPPRGYDPEHPFIEDLKRKDFIASRTFSEAEACEPEFIDVFAAACAEAAPSCAF